MRDAEDMDRKALSKPPLPATSLNGNINGVVENRGIRQHVGQLAEIGSNGHDNNGIEPDEKMAPENLCHATTDAAVDHDVAALESKYAPFVRTDIYGLMGRDPISLWEQLKLAVAAFTLLPTRLILSLFFLLVFFSVCKVVTVVRWLSRRLFYLSSSSAQELPPLTGLSRTIVTCVGRLCARGVLFAFGFYWIKETQKSLSQVQKHGLGLPLEDAKKWPTAIVSNHVSYIDILYYMSSNFPSFVSKKGVAEIPFVGLISKCMGCVYVDREGKDASTKGVSGLVFERMRATNTDKNAAPILLFPEGTTTNGCYLLPFKTGAFVAGTPIQPVLLKYPHQRFSPAWESVDVKRHLFLLLCQFVNRLEVVRFPVYHPSLKESTDPRLFAQNVRTLLMLETGLRSTDLGLYDKRLYLAALRGDSPPSSPHEKTE